jgi:hypothetical protein
MGAFIKGCGAKAHDSSKTLVGGTSILWGFGGSQEDKLRECWKGGLPFFHLDHAYFKRGYRNPPDYGRFRANYCHFHQTRLIKNLPPERANPLRKRLQAWKKDGANVIVIIPSDRISGFLGEREWAKRMALELKRHTDRSIVVKEKGPGLGDYLANAWAVVSLTSVAEVEAVMAGVPVFVGPHSPACQVGSAWIEEIERPQYPDREDWLRTLSYSQFDTDEMASGKAWGIMKELYGNHDIL